MAKGSKVYFGICVEEEYYDELIDALQEELDFFEETYLEK